MACSTCTYVSTWFKEYLAHPYGQNATTGDYVLTGVLALLGIFILWKLAELARKEL